MFFVLGAFCGFCREVLVVQWQRAVYTRKRLPGSGLSLGIGLLDLLVLAKLALDKNVSMAVGYVVGESLGTFFAIGK